MRNPFCIVLKKIEKIRETMEKTKYIWYLIQYMPLSGKEMLRQFKKAGWIEISQIGTKIVEAIK
jgi:hypothetical protein